MDKSDSMRNKKVKRGRPALAPEDVKKVFPLRISQKEMDLFSRAAVIRRVSVRDWMLLSLLRDAGGDPNIIEASRGEPQPNRKTKKARPTS